MTAETKAPLPETDDPTNCGYCEDHHHDAVAKLRAHIEEQAEQVEAWKECAEKNGDTAQAYTKLNAEKAAQIERLRGAAIGYKHAVIEVYINGSDAETLTIAQRNLEAALAPKQPEPCKTCAPNELGKHAGYCPDCQGTGKAKPTEAKEAQK